MKKLLLLVVLQLLLGLPLMAAVFVVTSNADSGTGTLRQALKLAAANGGTEKDYIKFNLPDQTEAGRTITLLSSLPEVPSNIVIDGSTQAGQKIGISDAKITITLNAPDAAGFKCFWANNATDIEVDGFYFNAIALPEGKAIALLFNKVNNITIGSSARGNVFGMVDTPVGLTLCSHVTLSANWFGINPKTSQPAITPYSTNILIASSTTVKIGGDYYSDGNVFAKAQAGHESVITDVDNCTFKCNTFGYKTTAGGAGNSLKFNNIGTLSLFSNIYNYGSVNYITNVTVLASIKSNRTNLDSKQVADPASTSVTPFELDNVKKTIFGGINPREGNTVSNPTYTNDYPSLIAKNCGDVLLQRNAMSCKSTADAYVSINSKVTLPVISITSVNNNTISGKATPNSTVEIYSDSQCQLCEPNTYLASVTATAAGTWTYTATGTASGYTASASTTNRTSLFARVGYDVTGIVVTQPACGQQNGSIKGIKVINATKTEWTNAAGRVISNDVNIENLGPGTYTFKAYLGQYCSTKSVSYTLTGVVMDDAQKIITQASCVTGKGSISNIKVTGATTYQWFNSSNTGMATTPDLLNVPPGDYHLVASNGTCSVTSAVYSVVQQTNTINYGGLTKTLKDATCDASNGSIEVTFSDNPPALPKQYRWVNHASNLTVATTTTPLVTGLDAGTYDLYVTDNNSCEKFLIAYTISRIPGLTVTTNKVQVTDDNCGISAGSIKGLGISGKAPLTITWTDAAGKTIANTADLLNITAGTYHIKITDGSGCEQGMVYHVGNQTTVIPTPIVNDVLICSPGEAAINVSNVTGQYTYRLYETGGSLKPIDEQKNGKFKVTVKANRSYYISQFMGTCESNRAEVKVGLEITSADIGNAFSPNGDGINDYWKLTGIESYPKAEIQIYTRDGQKIYQSTGYAIPFNGTYNGRQLPIGTYYYIINLHAGCSLLSGSLTLIR